MTALSERAVACKGFEWMTSMHEVAGAICIRVLGGVPWLWAVDDEVVEHEDGDGPLPDLDDPATLGCLLALAREAWGDPCIHVAGDGITWQPVNGNMDDIDVGYQDTEQGALVALLEAAPQPGPVKP